MTPSTRTARTAQPHPLASAPPAPPPRSATAIAGPLGCAGKEMRTTYFKRARECTDSDLNGVKLYEYEAGS